MRMTENRRQQHAADKERLEAAQRAVAKANARLVKAELECARLAQAFDARWNQD